MKFDKTNNLREAQQNAGRKQGRFSISFFRKRGAPLLGYAFCFRKDAACRNAGRMSLTGATKNGRNRERGKERGRPDYPNSDPQKTGTNLPVCTGMTDSVAGRKPVRSQHSPLFEYPGENIGQQGSDQYIPRLDLARRPLALDAGDKPRADDRAFQGFGS
jgi:hypothetical protein